MRDRLLSLEMGCSSHGTSMVQVPLIDAHVVPLVERLLAVAAGELITASIRIMALSVLQWIAVWRTKALVRRKLVPSILPVLLVVMAGAELASEADEDSEAASVALSACEVLAALLQRTPPEYMVPLTVSAHTLGQPFYQTMSAAHSVLHFVLFRLA